MVSMQEVEKQLAAIGATKYFRFWGRSEIVELQHILIPGERIQVCMNGRYEGGFAVLCATDQRLLLIDKKLFHLSVEDIRYDMIAEVDYSSQMAAASARIVSPSKNLNFTAIRPQALRRMVNYVQQRVIEIRQNYSQQQRPQQISQPIRQLEPKPATAAPVQAASNQEVEVPVMPVPSFTNPYVNGPFLMRRRVGRFNPTPPATPTPQKY